LRTHSGEKPYRCEDCGAYFAAIKTLQEHRFKHTGLRPHRCPHCDRAFARKSVLKVHLGIHTAQRPYVCEDCGKSFAQPGILRQHCKMAHSGEPGERTARGGGGGVRNNPTETCPDCGKTLFRSSMRDHRLLHTGARPYVCSVCNQSFTKYHHLKDHSVRHTGSRSHVCDQCGARFSRSYSLKVHQRLHSGETPFSCDECGMAFMQKSNLQQHRRSHHTRDRPYVCSYCGECFMWAKDQALHVMRRHTHDKPFNCEFCGRQFLTKYQLRVHTRLRHSTDEAPPPPIKRRHECSHCPASFVKKASLIRHVKNHFEHLDGSDQEEESSSIMDEAAAPVKRRHECSHCTASFVKKSSLLRHVANHCKYFEGDKEEEEESLSVTHEQPLPEYSVPAGYSHASSKDRSSQQAGQKHHQQGDLKPVKSTTSSTQRQEHNCPHCQLSFSKLALLSRHVRTHFSLPGSDDEEHSAGQATDA